MGLTLLTPPATEPVTLTDAKLHVREFDSGQDTVITALITAARKYVEERCRRSLITQTWVLTRDQFPSPSLGSANWAPFEMGIPRIPPGDPTASDLRRNWYSLRLPRGPVQSISSINYYDTAGQLQTLSPATYEADISAAVALVCPVLGSFWPATILKLNAVSVTYITGFGAAAAVPGDIIAAIKLLLGGWYENREAVAIGTLATMAPVPFAVDALLAPYELPEAA